MSYTALQCLAAAFFARRTKLSRDQLVSTDAMLGMHGNQPTILDQGAALYGKALRQLGARINDKDTCYDHENVSATMALHLYEVGLDMSLEVAAKMCNRPSSIPTETAGSSMQVGQAG